VFHYIQKKITESESLGAMMVIDTTYGVMERFRRKWGLKDGRPIARGITTLSIFDAVDKEGKAIYVYTPGNILNLPSTSRRSPYRGPGTGQKRAYGDFSVSVDSLAVRDLRDLVLILSQLNPGKNLRSTIINIIESRTNVPYEVVDYLFPKVYGGTAEHRHDVYGRSDFDIGTCGLEPHWFRISGDEVDLKGRDYPIAFQELFCAGITMGALKARSLLHIGGAVNIRLGIDETILEQIVEDPPEIDSEIPIHKVRGNRVITADIRRLVDRRFILPGATELLSLHEAMNKSDIEVVASKALTILGLPAVLAASSQGILPSNVPTSIFDWREYQALGHQKMIHGVSRTVARLAMLQYIKSSMGQRGAALEWEVNDLANLATKYLYQHAARLNDDGFLSQRGVNQEVGEGGMFVFQNRLSGLISRIALNMIDTVSPHLIGRIFVPRSGCPPMHVIVGMFLSICLVFDHKVVLSPQQAHAFRVVQHHVRTAEWTSLTDLVREVGKAASILGDCMVAGVRAIMGQEKVFSVIDTDGSVMSRGFRSRVIPDRSGIREPYRISRFRQVWTSRRKSSFTGTIELDNYHGNPISSEELAELTVKRHAAMTGGITTGAGCAWSRVLTRKLVRGKTCFVIGAGFGGIMALVAHLGGKPVGLDLVSNMPEGYDLASLKPPEIQATGYDGAYDTRGIMLGGNWIEIGSLRLSHLRPEVVIIDIESGNTNIRDLIMPLRGYTGIYVMRLFGDKDWICNVGSALPGSQKLSRISSYDSTGSAAWVIVSEVSAMVIPDILYMVPGAFEIHDDDSNMDLMTHPLQSDGLLILNHTMSLLAPQRMKMLTTSLQSLMNNLYAMIVSANQSTKPRSRILLGTCISMLGTVYVCFIGIKAYQQADWDGVHDLVDLVRTSQPIDIMGIDIVLTKRSLKVGLKLAGRLIAGARILGKTTTDLLHGIDLE
jgi:hypothetical protein